MKCCFVRALWGDERNPMLYKVHGDITRAIESYNHPTPIVTYSYGEHNQKFLESLCVASTLLPMTSVTIPQIVDDFSWRGIKSDILQAESVYGTRFWVLKLQAIWEALQTHDAVVWLDWDIQLLAPLPSDFWEQRAKGPTFQGGLRDLTRNHCPWRPCGNGQTPHGGVVYCRDAKVVQRLIVLQHVLPLASDEELFAIHVEMEFGGWDANSVDRWTREGYEFPNYRHRGQLFKPTQVIFWHGPRRV